MSDRDNFSPLICPQCGTSYIDFDPAACRAKIYVGKNKNEYFLDGRRYVDRIRECRCRRIVGGGYALYCDIIRRGSGGWFYRDGEDRIVRAPDGGYPSKTLWLSENAKKTVLAAIKDYQNLVSEIKETSEKVSFDGEKTVVFYRHVSRWEYDAVLEEARDGGIEVLQKIPLSGLLAAVSACLRRRDGEKPFGGDLLFETFSDAAERSNDESLSLQLRHCFNRTSKEDDRQLEKELGGPILSVLPEEYDKTYIVDADAYYLPLLLRSNYSMTHYQKSVFFFAAKLTYAKWLLNPHRRSGAWQAKQDAVSIPFSEYLKLFDQRAGLTAQKKKENAI